MTTSEKPYTIYCVKHNTHTLNYGGEEWVIDGERGFCTYPGYWTKEEAIAAYQRGE